MNNIEQQAESMILDFVDGRILPDECYPVLDDIYDAAIRGDGIAMLRSTLRWNCSDKESLVNLAESILSLMEFVVIPTTSEHLETLLFYQLGMNNSVRSNLDA